VTFKTTPPFKTAGAGVDEFFHKSLRAIGFEYYKRITIKTPRKTGRAAGNWQISINQPTPGPNNKSLPVKGTYSSAEAGKLSKRNVKNYPTITISNALPYIIALEYGHSKQARLPEGMVRVTMAELHGWSSK